jgi:hypothetical protein
MDLGADFKVQIKIIMYPKIKLFIATSFLLLAIFYLLVSRDDERELIKIHDDRPSNTVTKGETKDHHGNHTTVKKANARIDINDFFLENKNHKDNLSILDSILADGTPLEWDILLQYIDDNFAKHEINIAKGKVAASLAHYDPVKCIDLINSLSPGKQYSTLVRHCLTTFTDVKHIEMLLRNTISRNERDEIDQLAFSLASMSNSGVNAITFDNPDIHRIANAVITNKKLADSVAKSLAQSIPTLDISSEMIVSYSSQIPAAMRDSFLSAALVRLATTKPEELTKMINTSAVSASGKKNAIITLALHLSSNLRFDYGYKIANDLPPDDKKNFLQEFSTALTKKDSVSTSAFVQAMPKGEDRDVFVASIIDYCARVGDLNSAHAWLPEFHNPEAHQKLIEYVNTKFEAHK